MPVFTIIMVRLTIALLYNNNIIPGDYLCLVGEFLRLRCRAHRRLVLRAARAHVHHAALPCGLTNS